MHISIPPSPAISTNDPDTAISGRTPQDFHDPADADPSQKADVEPASTDAKRVQHPGPDTGVRESTLASRRFQAAGLSQARRMVIQEVTHLICLSMDHLWESYPLDDGIITGVKQHLVGMNFLSGDGKWSKTGKRKITRGQFEARSRGNSEATTFAFFAHLFNTVLEHIRQSRPGTSVKRMVHAGYTEPDSTRISTNRPDAFLHMATKPPSASGRFKWRDLTCPFEYKFRKGDTVDVSQPG